MKGVLRKMRESDVMKKDIVGVINFMIILEEYVIVICVIVVVIMRLRFGLLEVICLGSVLGFLELEWIYRRVCLFYWSVLVLGVFWV